MADRGHLELLDFQVNRDNRNACASAQAFLLLCYRKLLLCRPLARVDCAKAQSFLFALCTMKSFYIIFEIKSHRYEHHADTGNHKDDGK